MIRDSTRCLLHAHEDLWLLYASSVRFGIPSPALLAPSLSSFLSLPEMLSIPISFDINLFATDSYTWTMYYLTHSTVHMMYCHYTCSNLASPMYAICRYLNANLPRVFFVFTHSWILG